MDITFKPQQVEFLGAPEQFVAYIGGIGTGKSTSLIAKALFHSKESDGNLGVIIRKNFVDLRDSTMRDFTDYTGLPVNQDRKEVKLPNGSVIMFRHGDELPVLKNLNLGWFAIEQAEEFGDSLPWDMLIQRLRRNVLFRTGFVVANANGHNWVWDKWVKNQYDNHYCVQATTYDFKDILPPDYITNLEKHLPQKLFNRFVMNSHEIGEGLVFDEFNESIHLCEPYDISPLWERGFILDHGFTNPTAALWYAIDFDGNIVLYDEHYMRSKSPSYHADEIKKRGITKGYCDPSIFSKTQSRNGEIFSIADEYREFGIDLVPAVRSNEAASIARVNEYFKANKIKVFNTLANFRSEINNWKYRARNHRIPGNEPEVPEDKDNHLMDDLKYLIASRFGASVLQDIKLIQGTKGAFIDALSKASEPKVHSYQGHRYSR